MNPRRKRFCDEYIISGNATEAAKKAGYSPRTAKSNGQRLLTFADCSAYIAEQLENLHTEKTADAREVLEYLTSVMRGEITEQCLQLVGDGTQEIVSIEVGAKDRIKAAELLGKRYGLWTDHASVELNVPVVFQGEEWLE